MYCFIKYKVATNICRTAEFLRNLLQVLRPPRFQPGDHDPQRVREPFWEEGVASRYFMYTAVLHLFYLSF